MGSDGKGEAFELQSPVTDSERDAGGKDPVHAGGASHTGQDEADMLRLGRSQQLKVRVFPALGGIDQVKSIGGRASAVARHFQRATSRVHRRETAVDPYDTPCDDENAI